MQKSVVILAAGSISQKFTSFRPQFSSAGLFPVNSRSLISYTLDFYCREPENEITVVANSKDEALIKKELSRYDFRLVSVDNTRSVNETLQVFLQKGERLHEDIILSLVTTIPTQMPLPGSMQLSDRQEFCHFYSAVADISNGNTKFYHRGSGAYYYGYPFTGVIRTRLSLLKEAVAKCKTDDLLEVAELIWKEGKLSFMQTEWIDCGHEVNYSEARARLLSSRSFNSLRVEMISGILEKRSSNIDKFIHETNYVEMLPPKLKVFFPRVIESLRINGDHGSVRMDYFSYPNISELQLYRDVEEVQWHRIFEAFEFVIRNFQQYPHAIDRRDFLGFYVGKTLKREEQNKKWIKAAGLEILENDSLVINGLACKPFRDLLPAINKKTDNLYNEKDFFVMHGDFCFNNILYDQYSGTIRLIDPRGSFGEEHVGIYGDTKYDLAKLLHSSVYFYDYIVNDLFQFSLNGNKIDYAFNLRSNHELLTSLSEGLVKKLGYDPESIKFIVGLLFISMCPLHSDSLDRQKLMYSHGLYLLNQTLNHR